MNKRIFFFLILLLPVVAFSQVIRKEKAGTVDGELRRSNRGEIEEFEDEPGVIERKDKPPITEYDIISIEGDTTFVDTTLSIYKDYRFNYLRRDVFELLPFANVGQPYTKLSYNFDEDYDIAPEFGARAKHFNFFEANDIFYYHVPTPFTELYFKTAFEQGQQLDAFFTTNISYNLNFSIAYKGVRSLGKYQHVRSNSGNFRSTINYFSENRRYFAKAHFVAQDISNQVNGGLTPVAIENYINEVDEFDDRSLLEVRYDDAQNVLYGKRFYLNHYYEILKQDTTAVNSIQIGHESNFSDKKYRFEQAEFSEYIGEAFQLSNISDEVKLENVYNEAFVKWENNKLGALKFKTALRNFNYGYNSLIYFGEEQIRNRIIGEIVSVGAEYKFNYNKFFINAKSMLNLSEDFEGHHLSAQVSHPLGNQNLATIGVSSNSRLPNFNFLLYQSEYVEYNWENNFENQSTRTFSAKLLSENLVNIEADFSQIENYTYFGLNEDTLVKPKQANVQLKYFKLKMFRNFTYGRFSLANTILYQEVLNGQDVFHVPTFVTRNSLYYEDYWFDRALFLQTGLTFKYFTGFRMDSYDPVLSEFYVQDLEKIKGFPTLDYFFNVKIQQTRIFFQLEHLNALITGNTNFAAPAHPYRDFSVRFGLVWNFFL